MLSFGIRILLAGTINSNSLLNNLKTALEPKAMFQASQASPPPPFWLHFFCLALANAKQLARGSTKQESSFVNLSPMRFLMHVRSCYWGWIWSFLRKKRHAMQQCEFLSCLLRKFFSGARGNRLPSSLNASFSLCMCMLRVVTTQYISRPNAESLAELNKTYEPARSNFLPSNTQLLSVFSLRKVFTIRLSCVLSDRY